ncbi:MAG: P-loop NTPase [Ignavibacteriales bacterium]
MIGQAERLLELNKLKASSSAGEARGRIVAFSSGKGGTGKTFISLNTAYALSRMRKKVLLIDLDANLSNINIMLNIRPEKTLISYLQHRCALKDLVTMYETGLYFIFGDSGKLDYPASSEHTLDNMIFEIRELCAEFDYVILDIGAGADENVIHLLKEVHTNILIVNPEPTAIMDAYVIIKLLHNAGAGTQNMAVVNKCYSEKEAATAFSNLSKAAQHFLNETIIPLGYIENEQSVNRAIMAQELYIRKNPHSKTSMQIVRIAQSIIQKSRSSEVRR